MGADFDLTVQQCLIMSDEENAWKIPIRYNTLADDNVKISLLYDSSWLWMRDFSQQQDNMSFENGVGFFMVVTRRI